MRLDYLACLALAYAIPTAATGQEAAHPDDVGSVDGIINAFYAVISGPAGAPREWGRDSTLYVPGVLFVAMGMEGGEPIADVMDHGTYVRSSDAFFVREGFFEREIHRVTRHFGNLAHVFSTYEYRSGDGSIRGRGVNSLQLFWDGTRWWIANVMWDNERPDNPIPPEFLPH